MKKIYIITNDDNVEKHWKTLDTDAYAQIYIFHSVPDFLKNTSPQSRDFVFLQLTAQIMLPEDLSALIETRAQVVVFSNQPSSQQAIPLFKLGIKGYLNTFTSPNKIQQAIATIESGNIWLGQDLLKAMIQASELEVQPHWLETLTDREIETAQLILRGKSNFEIAQVLEISERTVKKFVHNVLEKYQVKDRLALVLKINRRAMPS